ncbi:amidohydrolase [Granulicoccus sp. GXG6511]|uniref:amidohydrolase n=1 Tax=Granulicoccus sp. GXG6511 TaxID=3381351 RepID=UPI003D7CE15E
MSPASAVLQSLDTTNAWQEELYIHLHQNPELSMQETETAAEITRRLESFGYAVQQIGGGVVGVMENGDGPTVLFRADIDALPVEETTGLPYASTKTGVDAAGNTVPIMHACGHDMHVAAGLGAAELLSQNKDKWSGTYIALFQPGEETAEGAQAMVDDGLVDKVPTPDVALGQHVLTVPEAGKVGTTAGPMLSTGACIRVKVWGKGSHGSMPHLGIDPVLLSAAIVQRLQGIVAREIAPSQFGVVTVGSLQAGFKANIIPDSATLLLNIRAYDMEVRKILIAAIERIVKAECEASNSPKPPEIELYESFPLTDNDEIVSDRITDAFRAHFGEDRVEKLSPIPASEDFSNIPSAWGIPYTYWGFGGFTPGMTVLPNHNPGFAPAIQPSLRTGTEAAVVAILAYLGKAA